MILDDEVRRSVDDHADGPGCVVLEHEDDRMVEWWRRDDGGRNQKLPFDCHVSHGESRHEV